MFTKIWLITSILLLNTSEAILFQQVGIKEVGKNKGPMIEKYLASIGLPEGYSYCLAGQYYCFEEAAKLTGLQNPLPKTGLVMGLWNWAKKNGKIRKGYPERHDLICWQKGKSIFGHIGRIIEVQKKGWVKTIEFNTGSDIREGDGVYIRKRNLFQPLQRMKIKGLIGWEIS